MRTHRFLLLWLLCALPLAAGESDLVGISEAEIVARFGPPRSVMDLGAFKVLGYPGRLLEIREGRVTAERPPPVPSPASPTPAASPKVPEAAASAEPAQEGATMELSFTSLDDRSINLRDFEGKVVVIDFWATWCGPCVAEVPHLLAAYKKYHPRGLEVIGISLDQSKDKLLAFLQQNEIPWPQYFDGKGWGNAISSRNGINAIPSLWLIDKRGRLVSKNIRGNLERAIEKALSD